MKSYELMTFFLLITTCKSLRVEELKEGKEKMKMNTIDKKIKELEKHFIDYSDGNKEEFSKRIKDNLPLDFFQNIDKYLSLISSKPQLISSNKSERVKVLQILRRLFKAVNEVNLEIIKIMEYTDTERAGNVEEKIKVIDSLLSIHSQKTNPLSKKIQLILKPKETEDDEIENNIKSLNSLQEFQ